LDNQLLVDNLIPINFLLIHCQLPVSGVDIERSFSNYKSTLSDRRIALKEGSIQMLNFLYFNLDDNVDYDLLIN
jgi:hypothetical protein